MTGKGNGKTDRTGGSNDRKNDDCDRFSCRSHKSSRSQIRCGRSGILVCPLLFGAGYKLEEFWEKPVSWIKQGRSQAVHAEGSFTLSDAAEYGQDVFARCAADAHLHQDCVYEVCMNPATLEEPEHQFKVGR